jgi:hypothetical protein
MCVRCEFQLFEDHRASETGCDTLCPKCGKFPASATGDECYHCFPVGNIAHECPKCNGKPWSDSLKIPCISAQMTLTALSREVSGDFHQNSLLIPYFRAKFADFRKNPTIPMLNSKNSMFFS